MGYMHDDDDDDDDDGGGDDDDDPKVASVDGNRIHSVTK